MKNTKIILLLFIFITQILSLSQIGFVLNFSTPNYHDSTFWEDDLNDGITASASPNPLSLIFGTHMGPSSIDPHYAWDLPSINVIDQVVEGLYSYDLSAPDMKIIPRLAADYGTWTDGGLRFIVPLRTDVIFHDSTPFNANVVEWNFDRLAYFMNLDGSLPEDIPETLFSSLFLLPDGNPIINSINIINDFTVEFVLNQPYIPFESLLCLSGAGMLSPNPLSTPNYNYIDIFTGNLVGTGPFIYDGYIENTEVNFHANPLYWAGKSKIDLLKYLFIPNPYERTQALINKEIDFINSPDLSQFQDLDDDPDITLINAGPGMTAYFLCMNNQQIPLEIRKAISYTLNYDYIIDSVIDGKGVRLRSPIPEGILYANWSLEVPETDITTARLLLINSELYDELPDIYDDQAWIDLANQNPLETYTYIYRQGNALQLDLFNIVKNSLENLGIEVIGEGLDYGNFIDRIVNNKNLQQLFLLGWGAEYNDPSNFINPIYGIDARNFAQLNDGLIQQWINDGLSETNPTAREKIYDAIQQRLIEELYPMCWLFVENNYDAYSNDFVGFQSNPFDKVWFYPILPKIIRICPSGDAEIDTANFQKAFDIIAPEGSIILCEGTFYLNKPILITNFDGTFKGQGSGNTVIQNIEDQPFPLSEIDPIHPFQLPTFFYFGNDQLSNIEIFNMSLNTYGTTELWQSSDGLFFNTFIPISIESWGSQSCNVFIKGLEIIGKEWIVYPNPYGYGPNIYDGIYIYSEFATESNEIVIQDCSIQNSGNSLILWGLNQATVYISNNSLKDSIWRGIYFRYCEDLEIDIVENTFLNIGTSYDINPYSYGISSGISFLFTLYSDILMENNFFNFISTIAGKMTVNFRTSAEIRNNLILNTGGFLIEDYYGENVYLIEKNNISLLADTQFSAIEIYDYTYYISQKSNFEIYKNTIEKEYISDSLYWIPIIIEGTRNAQLKKNKISGFGPCAMCLGINLYTNRTTIEKNDFTDWQLLDPEIAHIWLGQYTRETLVRKNGKYTIILDEGLYNQIKIN